MPSWINDNWGGLNLRSKPLQRPPEDSVSCSNVILNDRGQLKRRQGLSNIENFKRSPEGLKKYFTDAVKDAEDLKTVYGPLDLGADTSIKILGFTTFDNNSKFFVLTSHGPLIQRKAGGNFEPVKLGGFPGINLDNPGESRVSIEGPVSFGEKNGVLYFSAKVAALGEHILFKYDGEYWYRAGLPIYNSIGGGDPSSISDLYFGEDMANTVIMGHRSQGTHVTGLGPFSTDIFDIANNVITIKKNIKNFTIVLSRLASNIASNLIGRNEVAFRIFLATEDDPSNVLASTTVHGSDINADIWGPISLLEGQKLQVYLSIPNRLPAIPTINVREITASLEVDPETFFIRLSPWNLDHKNNFIFGDFIDAGRGRSIVEIPANRSFNLADINSFSKYGTALRTGHILSGQKINSLTNAVLFEKNDSFNYRKGDIISLGANAVTLSRWGLPSELPLQQRKNYEYSNDNQTTIPVGAILNYPNYFKAKEIESSRPGNNNNFTIREIREKKGTGDEVFYNVILDRIIKRTFKDELANFDVMLLPRNGLFIFVSKDESFGWNCHSFFPPNVNTPNGFVHDLRLSDLNSFSNGGVKRAGEENFPIPMEDVYSTEKVKGIPPKAKYISFTEDQMILANTRNGDETLVKKGSEFHFSDTSRGSTVETFHPLDVVEIGRDHQGEVKGISFDRQGIVIMKEREVFYLTGNLFTGNIRVLPTLSDGQGLIAPEGHAIVANGTAFVSHLGIYHTSRGQKPIELSDSIQPLFNDPSENLDFENAVMLNSFDEEKLFTWIPAKEGEKGKRGRAGIVLIFDYYYRKWFIWDVRSASLGMAFYKNGERFGLTAMNKDDGILVPNGKTHDVIDGRAVPFQWHYETSDFYAGFPFLKKVMNRLALINTEHKKIKISVSVTIDWTNQIQGPDGSALKMMYNFNGEAFLLQQGLPVSSFRGVRFRLEGEDTGELLLDALRIEYEGSQYSPTDGENKD